MLVLLYFVGLLYLVPKLTKKAITLAYRTTGIYKKLLIYVCTILVIPFVIMLVVSIIGLSLFFYIYTNHNGSELYDVQATTFNHAMKFITYWLLGTIYSGFIVLKTWYIDSKNYKKQI